MGSDWGYWDKVAANGHASCSCQATIKELNARIESQLDEIRRLMSVVAKLNGEKLELLKQIDGELAAKGEG